VTKQVLVHHTVCACTGMPRQDLEMLFEYRGVTPELRLGSLKTMVPTTKFGETFQYSNLLVMAGGYAAAHALYPKLELGAAFDKAMQKQVFDPLGMKGTTYDFKRAAGADHATPHAFDLAGTISAIPLDDETWVTTVRPAGGQWSSVHDYARVLQLELGKGMLDGKRVVSEANLLERRKPQVRISDELSYGMGLVVGTMNGVPVVTHDGGTAGFTTDYFWLPEHGVGVVIVSNVGASDMFVSAVRRRIYEELFDAEARAETDLARQVAEQKKDAAVQLGQVKLDVDPTWLAPLLGAWSTPGLGRIEVSVHDGKVVVDAGEWRVSAGEKHGTDGTHALETTGAPFAGFELVPEQRDGKPVLVLHHPQHDYVFEKLAR
jgi:CubicO group peptidase (beta-lactamase class C family)